MDWNPGHANGTQGMEWLPFLSGVVTLDGPTKAAAVSVLQTVSQAIPSVKLPISALPTRGGVYVVEAFDNETGVVGTITQQIASPNEDVAGVGAVGAVGWHTDAGSTTNIYTAIDEVNLNVNDWIEAAGSPAKYVSRMNTGGLTMTGRRVTSVRLGFWAHGVGNAVNGEVGLRIGGVDYSRTYAFPATPTQYEAVWYNNPATGAPWTIADIAAFDTTNGWFIGLRSGGYVVLRCLQAWMVVWSAPENRLASGVLDDRTSGLAAGYNTVTMTTPTGGTWTKDAAGKHLYVVRRVSSVGAITIPYIATDSKYTGPFVNVHGWTPTFNTENGTILAMNTATDRFVPIIPQTTGPVDSVDAQPYAALTEATVYTGNPAQQEMSNMLPTAYGIVRVICRCGSACTDPLLVKVRRRSDDAQIGGVVTIMPGDVDLGLPGGRYALVTGSLKVGSADAPAVLSAATQYYLEFSSVASGSAPVGENFWVVLAVDSAGVGDTAGFGGTTDRATFLGIEYSRYDLLTTIATVAEPPTTMAAVQRSAALGGQTACCVSSIPYLAVTWNHTNMGGRFARYEVQRSEDGGFTWVTIASLTTETDTEFDDYESLFGNAASYRVRTFRDDGSISAWSPTATATKAYPANASPMFFVSNYDPSVNYACDVEPDKDFDFKEAKDQVLVPIYGRDNELAFQSLEHRGTTTHYVATLGAGPKVPIGGTGVEAFAPLRIMAAAQIPYVAALDHYGTRVYARIAVDTGSIHATGQGTGTYKAKIAVDQIAATPWAVNG